MANKFWFAKVKDLAVARRVTENAIQVHTFGRKMMNLMHIC